MDENTVFLRLEGPFQAWGDAKYIIRRTKGAPTKSGVLGLVCSALGLSRKEAASKLPTLNGLRMGVRVDRPGREWWDWHTVGTPGPVHISRINLLDRRVGEEDEETYYFEWWDMKVSVNMSAEGKKKVTAKTKEYETLVTKRQYLGDASFLVALQGEPAVIAEIAEALCRPKRPVFLGRKSCPPSAPLFPSPRGNDDWTNPGRFENLEDALRKIPWRPRTKAERPFGRERMALPCLLEWRPGDNEKLPPDAELWYDAPISFAPPAHAPRAVLRKRTTAPVASPFMRTEPRPVRPRADYRNPKYRELREKRLREDNHLCVFCKSPANTVQHITYRRAGGYEKPEDLVSLCRLCHDAVTMLEYGHNMGMERIDPRDPFWRERIIKKRDDIIKYRSLEIRRRRLTQEEVE